MLRRPLLALVLPLAALQFACGGGSEAPAATGDAMDSPAASASGMAMPTLAEAEALEVRNARLPMARTLTGGQPTPEQFEALEAAGIERFISLRPTSEDGAGWEEERAAGGADFARIPIAGAEDLTRENVASFAALLERDGEAPTMVYCASGNRAGALFALKAAWVDGMDPAAALELGREAGLTGLDEAVQELLGVSGR